MVDMMIFRRKLVKKKLLFLILSLLIGLTLFSLFFAKKDSEQTNEPPSNIVDQADENKNTGKIHIVDKVYTLAQKGMILNLTVIAGKSRYEEVTKSYGEPETIDETAVGNYANYPNHQVTIGYQDSIAFDLRSFVDELQDIHYLDILDGLGEPNEIKYYQDTENNQIILIYQVDSDYQLKWILNKPNENEQNPAVDHISVVAKRVPIQDQRDPSLTIPEIIDRMSIDEKIGQMIFAGISSTEPDSEAEKLINDYKVGGIIFNGKNMTSPAQTVAYINFLKSKNKKNKLPLFLGIDQEGGRISKLPGDLINIPTNAKIGEMNNPSFSFELGSVLGKLVSAYGFNINFAPVLDVNSNPQNPVIGDRSFSNSPNLVGQLGIQTMKGLQSEKIIPTIKHFPGHGDTSVDSHLELPTVNKSLKELEQLELIPFNRAIDEGADMVMIAHIMLPKIDRDYPSSLSEVVITELLRNKIGFDGVIITDDMTMEAITGNFDIGSAAVESVKAGSDIIMAAHDYEKMIKVISVLKKAVEAGEIPEERINESVTRILQLKERYGIDDTLIEKVNINKLNILIKSVLDKYK